MAPKRRTGGTPTDGTARSAAKRPASSRAASTRAASGRNGGARASETPAKDGAPRVRLNAADRRAQVINAAREVFLESGLARTRSRDIADQAGITEAFLYRIFSSKEEIYRQAIEIPLRELTGQLVTEIKELAQDETVPRATLLTRANEILLGALTETTPLLIVALFSELARGKDLYQSTIRPLLHDAIETIITDISGWDPPRVDLDVVVQGFFGIHFGAALDSILCDHPLDVEETAREITMMFVGGVQENLRNTEAAPRRKAASPVRRTSRAKPPRS